MTGEKIQQQVARRERFAVQAAGCEVVRMEPEYAVCRMANCEAIKNELGNPMGGALFTLGDYTFAVAANCVEGRFCITQSASVSYLKGAKGRWVIAEAKCVHSGHTTCVYTVQLRDEIGTEVALMTFTGYYLYERTEHGNGRDRK